MVGQSCGQFDVAAITGVHSTEDGPVDAPRLTAAQQLLSEWPWCVLPKYGCPEAVSM